MKKFLYDRMVEEYSKKSKEELIQEIMSLQEIETSDRAFANQCFAGTSSATINEIFHLKDKLDKKFTYKVADELMDAISDAKNGWIYIRDGLEEMKDPTRTYAQLASFRERLSNAEDPDDPI